MSDSKDNDRDFEKLSKAITETVMRSQKVRKIVAAICKKDKICSHSFMVLVLNMRTLMDSLEIEPHEDLMEKKPVKPARKKKSGQPQFIDGNKLSKNEIAFLEFVKERFDNDDWLKKNGLTF